VGQTSSTLILDRITRSSLIWINHAARRMRYLSPQGRACMENEARFARCPAPEDRVASPMLLLPLSLLLAGGADPEATPESSRVTTLDTVVVVSSRVAEPISQVVASVAQVDRAQLDRQLVRDPAGLVRYVPGVEVVSDGHRFGTRGFSIRGLDGNRVRIVVDGIPLADEYSIGQFAAAGRDLVDLEAVETVEIQRGPASTLYGSDALAGVVAFRTIDPDALLARGDGAAHRGLRLGIDGLDDSRLLGASWAAGASGDWQAMVVAAQRRGHEAGNRAWREADAPNPLDFRRGSVLAKLVRDAGDGGRYVLAFDGMRESRQTAVDSLRFGSGRFATTYRLDADDHQQRGRASLGGEWTPGWRWMQSLQAQAYLQQTDVRQDSAQYRLADAATPFESLRWRRFDYASRADGVGLLGQSRHEGRFGRHWQVFGIDLARQRYRGLRDGVETNLATGASSHVVLGEPLPVRDFPDSANTSVALYWQDEISIGARLALIPGARAEWNRLRASPDAIYREDFPDAVPVDMDTRQVTPRLALRWTPGGGHSLFAQYARGFRAPPFGDVNIGLLLPVFNYEVRANPELRPERSEGLEIGWRYVDGAVRASLSAYENRYRDLIESRANLGIDPVTRALVFQSVNRDRARIRGLEGDLLWNLPGGAARSGHWQLRGAFAWSRGDDVRRERPLNSIDPPRATLGLGWEPDHARWGVEAAMVAVRRQDRVDHGGGALFQPAGHARFDLYGWAEPWPGLRINAGILNLADRRYWSWSSVRGLSADADDLGFHTRPGRSAAVNVSFDW